MVQIGIPFLDPVGDAPVVQILSKKAIENGFTMEKFFRALSKLREETTLPLILRAYYTTYLAMEKTGLCSMQRSKRRCGCGPRPAT